MMRDKINEEMIGNYVLFFVASAPDLQVERHSLFRVDPMRRSPQQSLCFLAPAAFGSLSFLTPCSLGEPLLPRHLQPWGASASSPPAALGRPLLPRPLQPWGASASSPPAALGSLCFLTCLGEPLFPRPLQPLESLSFFAALGSLSFFATCSLWGASPSSSP